MSKLKWFYALPCAPSWTAEIVQAPEGFDDLDFNGPFDTFFDAKSDALKIVRGWAIDFQAIKKDDVRCVTWSPAE